MSAASGRGDEDGAVAVAWIEVQQSLVRHPKTRKAARQLDMPRVHLVGHLVALWAWAVDYARDGDLADFTWAEIEEGAEWEGQPDALVEALYLAGFLDSDDGGATLRLHDWDDYSGGKLEQLERKKAGNRRRQSTFRERHASPNALVTRDENPRNALRNPLRNEHTGPNRTGQDLTEPTATAPAREELPEVTVRVVGLPPPPPCQFAAAVGEEKFSEIAGNFTAVNPQLDAMWLRKSLSRFEAEGLGLPPPAMKRALKAAYLKCQDAFGRDGNRIQHPSAWAATQIKTAIGDVTQQPARASP